MAERRQFRYLGSIFHFMYKSRQKITYWENNLGQQCHLVVRYQEQSSVVYYPSILRLSRFSARQFPFVEKIRNLLPPSPIILLRLRLASKNKLQCQLEIIESESDLNVRSNEPYMNKSEQAAKKNALLSPSKSWCIFDQQNNINKLLFHFPS